MALEIGPRALTSLELPPDLYVIQCPKGYMSDGLPLTEVAKTLALLARECGQTHEITLLQDLTSV